MNTIEATQALSTAILEACGTTALYGPAGSGKSVALAGIAKEALAQGREVVAIGLIWGTGYITSDSGARVITRAPEAVRFLHGALDRFRNAEAGTVGPVILVEEFGVIAEEHPAVTELIRELVCSRSSVFTAVIATQRPSTEASIKGQSVVYLERPGNPVSTEAIAMAFGAQRSNAAHALLAEASAKGVYGHAVGSFHGRAPEALNF